MKTFGIDVSRWQGDFNFSKAKAEGVKFAILRGAYSAPAVEFDGGKDSKFGAYYTAAKREGLPVGVYQYSMARNVEDAQAEARYLHAYVLKGKTFELPIYIDVEDTVQRQLGKRLLTDIVKAWCEYLEERGYWVGIYSSTSFFSSYLYDDELQSYAHWAAQWDEACTYKGNEGVLGMWQFGGETNKLRTNKVAGVTCDQNYMLVDYPAKIKAKGCNGFTKAAETKPAASAKPAETKPAAKPAKPAKPAAADKTHTVKAGETLSGIAAKYGTTWQRLAAYNGIKNPSLVYPGEVIKIPKS
jgi:LysM repeat protein